MKLSLTSQFKLALTAVLVPALSIVTHAVAEDAALENGGVGLGVSQLLDKARPEGYGGVVVMKVLPDLPAEKAGVEKGDLITKVDGVDVSGLPIADVVSKIRGPVGEPVTLTFVEENGQEFSQELIRVELPAAPECPGTKE